MTRYGAVDNRVNARGKWNVRGDPEGGSTHTFVLDDDEANFDVPVRTGGSTYCCLRKLRTAKKTISHTASAVKQSVTGCFHRSLDSVDACFANSIKRASGKARQASLFGAGGATLGLILGAIIVTTTEALTGEWPLAELSAALGLMAGLITGSCAPNITDNCSIPYTSRASRIHRMGK